MTKKDLVRLIREVVKREVKTQVNNVLTEMENTASSKMSINEAIQKTEPFPTMKTFTSGDARAQFAAMQQGAFNANNHAAAFEGHNGRVVSAEKIDPSVSKALTRDYSELVKRFKK